MKADVTKLRATLVGVRFFYEANGASKAAIELIDNLEAFVEESLETVQKAATLTNECNALKTRLERIKECVDNNRVSVKHWVNPDAESFQAALRTIWADVEAIASLSTSGCPDGCGAAKVEHCWNTSTWAEEDGPDEMDKALGAIARAVGPTESPEEFEEKVRSLAKGPASLIRPPTLPAVMVFDDNNIQIGVRSIQLVSLGESSLRYAVVFSNGQSGTLTVKENYFELRHEGVNEVVYTGTKLSWKRGL